MEKKKLQMHISAISETCKTHHEYYSIKTNTQKKERKKTELHCNSDDDRAFKISSVHNSTLSTMNLWLQLKAVYISEGLEPDRLVSGLGLFFLVGLECR